MSACIGRGARTSRLPPHPVSFWGRRGTGPYGTSGANHATGVGHGTHRSWRLDHGSRHGVRRALSARMLGRDGRVVAPHVVFARRSRPNGRRHLSARLPGYDGGAGTVADGHLGIWSALATIYPESAEHRTQWTSTVSSTERLMSSVRENPPVCSNTMIALPVATALNRNRCVGPAGT
jgi:hypothetical protein